MYSRGSQPTETVVTEQFTEGLLPLSCRLFFVLVSWSDFMFQNKVKSQTLFILTGTIRVTIHTISYSKTEKQNGNFATLKHNWSKVCPLSHAVLSCKGKSALLTTYTMYRKSCSTLDPPSAYQAKNKKKTFFPAFGFTRGVSTLV